MAIRQAANYSDWGSSFMIIKVTGKQYPSERTLILQADENSEARIIEDIHAKLIKSLPKWDYDAFKLKKIKNDYPKLHIRIGL